MRWRWVLVKGGDENVRAIAESARQLVPCLTNPIDVSILPLRSACVPRPWVALQMVQFRNRPARCGVPPACVEAAFQQEIYRSGRGLGVRQELACEPHVGLAILASRERGEAWFLVCSDALNCSGHLRFTDGRLVTGSIYGWDGSEELWSWSPTYFQAEGIELTGPGGFDYCQPAADGLVQAIGPGADALYLSPSGEGTTGEWTRYRLMTNRQAVSPVVGEQDRD